MEYTAATSRLMIERESTDDWSVRIIRLSYIHLYCVTLCWRLLCYEIFYQGLSNKEQFYKFEFHLLTIPTFSGGRVWTGKWLNHARAEHRKHPSFWQFNKFFDFSRWRLRSKWIHVAWHWNEFSLPFCAGRWQLVFLNNHGILLCSWNSGFGSNIKVHHVSFPTSQQNYT